MVSPASTPHFGNVSSAFLKLLIIYYNLDCADRLDSNLYGSVLHCVCRDRHILATPQMVMRRNVFICNTLGRATSPHLSSVRAVMLSEPEDVCTCEFLRRICSLSCREWHEPQEHVSKWLHSCLFTCSTHWLHAVGCTVLNEMVGSTGANLRVGPCYFPIILKCELWEGPCLPSHWLLQWSREHWLQNKEL